MTIDGIVDAGYISADLKGTKFSGVSNNLTSTSQINFRVSSDLGGGMKATFRSETDWSPVSNGANTGAATQGVVSGVAANGSVAASTSASGGYQSAFGNGEQKLALSSASFGEVAFGAINNNALAAHVMAQPFGTALGSGFVGPVPANVNASPLGTNGLSGSRATASVRNDNSLQYTTPEFLGGFKVNYLFRKGQNASVLGSGTTATASFNPSLGAQQQGQHNSLSVAYNNGPLKAMFTRDGQDQSIIGYANAAGAATYAGNRGVYTGLAANYNMGAATVYAGYQINQGYNNSSNSLLVQDTKTINVAVTYVMGVNTLMANYARLNSNAGTSAGQSANLLGLGYEYALSKTAALTARYERTADFASSVNGTAAGALAANTALGYAAGTAGSADRTRMGVGLRVNF